MVELLCRDLCLTPTRKNRILIKTSWWYSYIYTINSRSLISCLQSWWAGMLSGGEFKCLIYTVQSLSSETGAEWRCGALRAHRWRCGMLPCQLVSRSSKRQLNACIVSRTTVIVVPVIWMRASDLEYVAVGTTDKRPVLPEIRKKRYRNVSNDVSSDTSVTTHWVAVLFLCGIRVFCKGESVWRMMCVLVAPNR